MLAIQVAHRTSGGFIFALQLNHRMSDAAGVVQFMSAVGEMARGNSRPSIEPIWNRELLICTAPHGRIASKQRDNWKLYYYRVLIISEKMICS